MIKFHLGMEDMFYRIHELVVFQNKEFLSI